MTIPFTENGRRIFDLRYPRKDDLGAPSETPEETIDRVVSNVAIVNALYEVPDNDPDRERVPLNEFPWRTARRQAQWLTDRRGDADYIDRIGFASNYLRQREKYRELISSLTFLPNSPTWTGAGTPLGQLAACFVLPIDDDLVTGRASIFETLKIAAAIQQTGGGNGFSFSRLRPDGSLILRSMGQASGPMGFLRTYDSAFGQIAQGGSRRGANMGVLRIDHPDIETFIESKTVEGEIANFNISVAITDEFMEAVEKDSDFDLVHGGKVYRTVRARDLWDKVTKNAWVIGDPGNLFIDQANRYNPVPTRYALEATNPCGEQWLGPYENCCLGSIAVNRFVTRTWTQAYKEGGTLGTFDWEAFKEAVILSTQFLDDVVDANQYVSIVPELEEAAQGGRRIGLGLMGLSDAMILMGIRYGSPEGLDFASQVTEFARFWTMMASTERAKDRGPFGWIDNSIYDKALLEEHGPGAEVTIDGVTFNLWEPPTPLILHNLDLGRPRVDWDHVVERIKAYGIRNSCQFTFAPTGTISNVAGLEGSGCEPLFALNYVRTVMQEGENIRLPYLSALFEHALEDMGLTTTERAAILEAVVANGGSCQGLDIVPEAIRNVFVVAADVTPTEHIWTQAVLQRFVDNSISKTINMPNEATVEDVGHAYRLAFDLGCKGITIYRQGSRELEVLATTTDKKGNVVDWPTITPLAIPRYANEHGLSARVYPVDTFYGKVQVTITYLEGHDSRPFDVRLQLGKAGNDKNADVESLGRMISLCLRAGVGVEWIVEQLEGIGGQTFHGFGERKVRSVADGVAKLFKRLYMPDADWTAASTGDEERLVVDTTMTCPNCGMASVVMESGCRHCDVRLGGCGEFSGCD